MLKNKLPESTSLHPHGVRVPNSMDGFDPLTQDPIKPGETFTYEWVALEPEGLHVPLPPRRPGAGAQRPGRRVPASATCCDLPAGTKVDHEVNMVLNDAGTIGLSLNGRSFPATEPYT